MKFEDIKDLMQKPEAKADTYEAGMAQNQLLKIGTHAIKIHNMLDDGQEMESWVAKKIDLASNYVKSVHGYTAGSKAGAYDDDGMTEMKRMPKGTGTMQGVKEDGMTSADVDRINKQRYSDKEVSMAKGVAFDKRNQDNVTKATSTIEKVRKGLSQQPDVADALRTANEDAGDEAMAKEIAKVYDNVVAYIQSDSDNDPNDQGGLRSGYDDEDLTDAEDLAREFRKNLQSGLMLRKKIKMKQSQDSGDMDKGGWDPFQDEGLYNDLIKDILAKYKKSAVQEDAGEGHMSKSQLYATAKMAIELIDMINKGDDLEGWVQTKLNLAADYLQAVYHYEDYQKLNPYREELDGALMQKHAGVIQKSLDGILARETEIADVDTKPGMMRILKKRVNEVEKEMAKENRKNTDEGGMPASVIKSKQRYANMSDEELADRFKGADEKTLRQMAWRHGYGNMSSHYLDRVKNVMTGKKTATTEAEISEDPQAVGRSLAMLNYGKDMATAIIKGDNAINIKSKAEAYLGGVDRAIKELDMMYKTPTTESELEEGIKDWAKNLAAAGIIVAGLAGFNSINNAIDNSVPAIQAMNSALEMAMDQNDDRLAQLIKKDLSDAKLRLDTGKDLSHVKDLQDKYAKFIKTEGLAYESKLAVQLKQQLK